jgi:CRISPR system Cascade subunit CasD
MPSFLTFTLAAPLASFGSIAVGERRASLERPSKSAVLGLVAGGLGVDRENNEAHVALAHELFYAVRTENMNVRSPRRLMMDYHTAQTPPRGRNLRFATRREELADKQTLETILSYREYRSDCTFSIALWPRVFPLRFPLETLAEALRKPVFVPYAGRKSCPLMLPMQPLVLEVANVKEAFEQRDAMCERQRAFLQCHGLVATPCSLALDADATDAADAAPGRHERRRDQVLNRCRWQFGVRDEITGPWTGGAA